MSIDYYVYTYLLSVLLFEVFLNPLQTHVGLVVVAEPDLNVKTTPCSSQRLLPCDGS